MNRNGCAKKIREFFLKKRFFKLNDNGSLPCSRLAKLLDLDRRTIRWTLRDFLRREELRIDNGYIVYIGINRQDFLADKVWRAWRYFNLWTVFEIAAVVHANVDTVRTYVKIYRKAGYIEKIGEKGKKAQYRLKDRSIRVRPEILDQRSLKRSKNNESST
jgi:hypothetical protein